MMFIIRTSDARLELAVKMTRRTPALAADGGGKTDYFCDGDLDAARAAGLPVVSVHDGWYADDTGGGVAIFGQGKFWEVRDTPFSVVESDDGAAQPPAPSDVGIVDVRGAIFGV